MDDPVDRIEWVECSTLHANNWNPNFVYNPELTLLERSILLQGWIQPVLVSRSRMVIDGFHRWTLASNSERLIERYGARVPAVVLDVDEREAMMITVRINRAKGEHQASRMHSLVRRLVDVHGCSRQEVATGIGATLEEVDLLYQADIFTTRKLENWCYSWSWEPVDPPKGFKRGASLDRVRREHGPGGEFEDAAASRSRPKLSRKRKSLLSKGKK